MWSTIQSGFSDGSEVKNPLANAGDGGLILCWGDPPKKEMATCSGIIAWRIPWTEEPGGLQSMRLPRVGHGWARGITAFTCVTSADAAVPSLWGLEEQPWTAECSAVDSQTSVCSQEARVLLPLFITHSGKSLCLLPLPQRLPASQETATDQRGFCSWLSWKFASNKSNKHSQDNPRQVTLASAC